MTISFNILAENMFFEAPASNLRAYKSFKKKAQDMNLVGVGGAYYAPKTDTIPKPEGGYQLKPGKTPSFKNEKDQLVPVSEKERAVIAKNGGQVPSKSSSDREQPSTDIAPSISSRLAKYNFEKGLNKHEERQVRLFQLNPRLKNSMGREGVEKLKNFYADLRQISNLPAGNKRKQKIENLISNYNLQFKKGRTKLYANVFPAIEGAYKVLGNTLSRETEFLEMMAREEGIDIPEAESSQDGVKAYLSGQSKPDFGKYFTSFDDELVQKIFTSEKTLSNLDPAYQRLYGPASKQTGGLLQSGGQNSIEFFAHSVNNNNSIDKVISAAQQFANSKSASPALKEKLNKTVIACKVYKNSMRKVLNNFNEISDKERGKVVGDIYAKLASDLHVIDKEFVAPIMKNLAEIALYDKEIAEKQEVYLPAAGNFPAGDKLKVTRHGTKIEKIEAVSIKFGKGGNHTYGFSAAAANFCLYHPDEFYKDILAQRAGTAGYEMGIRGDVIHDASTFHLLANKSELTRAFDKKTLEEIRMLGVEMTMATKDFSEKYKNKLGVKKLTSKDLTGLESDPYLLKLQKKLLSTIEVKANQEQLRKIVGKNNYRMLTNPKNTAAFYSLMAFGAGLKTSDGFSTILHNHQLIQNGQLVSETETGTDLLKDWQMAWRPYGSNARGLTMGFSKQPE